MNKKSPSSPLAASGSIDIKYCMRYYIRRATLHHTEQGIKKGDTWCTFCRPKPSIPSSLTMSSGAAKRARRKRSRKSLQISFFAHVMNSHSSFQQQQQQPTRFHCVKTYL